MKNYSKLIQYILLFLGVAILLVFLKTISLSNIVNSLEMVGWTIILFLFSLTLLNVLAKSLRWKILVKKSTGKDISLWFAFASIFAGVSSGSLFPGRNEVTKPLMLKSIYKTRLTRTIPVAMIEKILDLLAIIAVFFIGFIFVQSKFNDYNGYLILFAYLTIGLLLFLFFFPKKIARLVKFIISKIPVSKNFKVRLNELNYSFFDSFELMKEKKSSLLLFSVSLLAIFIEVIRLYYLFLVLGIQINPAIAAIALCGSILFGVLTLIPGGIGVTEFSAAYIVFAFFNDASLEKIKSIVILDRIISYYTIVFFGSFVLLFYHKIFKKE